MCYRARPIFIEDTNKCIGLNDVREDMLCPGAVSQLLPTSLSLVTFLRSFTYFLAADEIDSFITSLNLTDIIT